MNTALTYILGAGASFQSFPLVNTFAGRFKQFIDTITGQTALDSGNVDHERNLYLLRDTSKILLKEFEDHQSFDTFFKKLYHIEDYKNIKLYKKVLNIYFIWEHTCQGYVINGKTDPDFFLKRANIDKRYDALIAGLLKPMKGEKKLFCKTNFITWNYDLNLLSSIKNYFFPNLCFGELIDRMGYENIEWKINDEITILNMNGYFYASVFDGFKNIPQQNSYDLIKSKIKADYLKDTTKDYDAECIRFAWEFKEIDKLSSIAFKMIEQSKNIVVIGYTFPLYNRLVDSKYLNGYSLKGKNVIIQDPNSIELGADFLEYFGVNQIIQGFTKKTSCNSFYVPQDIFNQD
jgi:hypothetical protein